MVKIEQTNELQVLYSVLMTSDNLNSRVNKKIRRIPAKVRVPALRQHMIVLDKAVDIDLVFNKLLERVKTLPPGTLFSVSSIVLSSSKVLAQKLGKRLSAAEPDISFIRTTTAYSGKWVYERLNILSECVNDFMVDVKFDD